MVVTSKQTSVRVNKGNKNVKVKPAEVVTAQRNPIASMNNRQPPTTRPTPYERLRCLLASEPTGVCNERRVISTIDELHEYRFHPEEQSVKITLEMNLLWVPDHTYKDLKLVRPHFIDAEHLHLRMSDWDDVAVVYNFTKDKVWKERKGVSLKRKFSCLYLSAKNHLDKGMSLVEKTAWDLHHNIKQIITRKHKRTSCDMTMDTLVTTGNLQLEGTKVSEGVTFANIASSFSTEVESQPAIPSATTDEDENAGEDVSTNTTADRGTHTTQRYGESGSTSLSTAKDTHPHCGVIQLFLWFQRRDERQYQQWRELLH
ncbi:hypothetical protein PC121_g7434 [Phytophthora cactorum]|nr:hypothetical protein PC121_g7434 [Phytophthora cactorum]